MGIQKKTRLALILLCCVLAAVLVALVCVVIGMDNKEKPEDRETSSAVASTVPVKKLVVEQMDEQGDMVILTTNYGVIKYPYAFSDLIHIETETFDYHAQMDFSAQINGKVVRLYTLLFNSGEGIPVGTLQVDGVDYSVTALLHEIDDSVSDENRITFFAAQETFNEVVTSLGENEGFTTAQ
jgi:hypothetical protein